MLQVQILDLLLIKVGIAAHLVLYPNAFHVVDLGSAKLVGILNGTLANFLVENSHVYVVLYGLVVVGLCVELVAFVGVLVSL